MASQIVAELRITTDAVWNKLSAQLQGMEPHMERSDGSGGVDDARSTLPPARRARLEAGAGAVDLRQGRAR